MYAALVSFPCGCTSPRGDIWTEVLTSGFHSWTLPLSGSSPQGHTVSFCTFPRAHTTALAYGCTSAGVSSGSAGGAGLTKWVLTTPCCLKRLPALAVPEPSCRASHPPHAEEAGLCSREAPQNDTPSTPSCLIYRTFKHIYLLCYQHHTKHLEGTWGEIHQELHVYLAL